jgi:hypothetical protein
MGQKTNPTSLRLYRTNKNFDSSWYSELHYSRLLGDDLVVKPFLEQVFIQAGLPRNLWSFSPITKRGRGLILYLSPDRSRANKSSKLRLGQPLPILQQAQKRKTLMSPKTNYTSNNSTKLNSSTIFHLTHSKIAYHLSKNDNKRENLIKRERKLFINLFLTQLIHHKGSKLKALSYNGSCLFQRSHMLSWLHQEKQVAHCTEKT